jgi:glycosyltransferase involved in cell wall biosynthesis
MKDGASHAQEMRLRVCMHVLGLARTDERVLREATALAQAGLDVTIVDVERDRARPREEVFRGVRLKHVIAPSWYKGSRNKLWSLLRILTSMLRFAATVIRTDAHIYHAHDDLAFPACFFAATLRGKRLVLDAHELPLASPALTKLGPIASAAHGFIRLAVSRANGVITVSAPIAREISRRYAGPTPALVRNVPMYHPPIAASSELRDHLDLSPQTRVALYQGGLRANRALDVLVRAAPFLAPGNVMVFMGDGDQEKALRALIASLRVADRVLITPAVPYDTLLRWTASADLGMIVYRPTYSLNVRYCLPNKLFEYMMAGVPTLSSSLDAVAEIIATYDTGRVVYSLEPEAVAGAINALLGDEAARKRMRENGWRAAREEFRWDIEQRHLLHLYDQLRAPQREATRSQPVTAQ